MTAGGQYRKTSLSGRARLMRTIMLSFHTRYWWMPNTFNMTSLILTINISWFKGGEDNYINLGRVTISPHLHSPCRQQGRGLWSPPWMFLPYWGYVEVSWLVRLGTRLSALTLHFLGLDLDLLPGNLEWRPILTCKLTVTMLCTMYTWIKWWTVDWRTFHRVVHSETMLSGARPWPFPRESSMAAHFYL